MHANIKKRIDRKVKRVNEQKEANNAFKEKLRIIAGSVLKIKSTILYEQTTTK